MHGAILRHDEGRDTLGTAHGGRELLAVKRRTPFAPLLEQERHAIGAALIAQGDNPVRVHRTRTASRLTTNHHPVDALQACVARVFSGHIRAPAASAQDVARRRSQKIDRAKQRLHRQPTNGRRRLEQQGNALVCCVLIFNRDAQPDVLHGPTAAISLTGAAGA